MTYLVKIKRVFAFTKKVHEITNEPSLMGLLHFYIDGEYHVEL